MVDRTETSLRARQEAAVKEMKERPKVYWPSWRYGPGGQSRIFQSEYEVPEGWEDHPSKVGKISDVVTERHANIPDDDEAVQKLVDGHTKDQLLELLSDAKEDNDDIEYLESWPKLKLAKAIVGYEIDTEE